MQRGEIYQIGSAQVEVLFNAGDAPVAPGASVTAIKENTVDAAKEKHVPVIEKVPGGYKVKVGAVPHPMVDDHYIVWIELTAGSRVMRQYLRPGEAPEATFMTDASAVTAREFCNKHGVWKA